MKSGLNSFIKVKDCHLSNEYRMHRSEMSSSFSCTFLYCVIVTQTESVDCFSPNITPEQSTSYILGME